MSRRVRASLFFALAAAAGLTGASMAGSYREGQFEGAGPLRPVVVTTASLPGSKLITPALARRRLTVVRVPERFAPAGAVTEVSRVIGLRTMADLPAGTYLSSPLIRSSIPKRRPRADRLAEDRQAVEIRVTGVTALADSRRSRLVDVVVTSEPSTGASGRTYVAAASVPLLSLAPSVEGGVPGSATAVLGLDRRQALHLIRAESFARGIRLLPRPSR